MSTIEHTSEHARTGTAAVSSGRHRARLAAVGGAIVAALAVWFVAEVVLGLDLRQPAASVGTQTESIDAVHVVISAAVGSLAGWALLAAERLTARPRRVWTAIAVVALVVSLGGPLSGSGITTSNRLTLVLMHVVVAAVVILALGRTARARR